MPEIERGAGQPADENSDDSHVVCDGVGDTLPYEHPLREPKHVQVNRGEAGVYHEISEIVLAGVADEERRPRYVHLPEAELPSPVDLLALFSLVDSDESRPEAEQRPGDLTTPAKKSPFLENADGLRFIYPSLSPAMLAYARGLWDRVMAEVTMTGPIPYPGVWESEIISAEETVEFPSFSGQLPDSEDAMPTDFLDIPTDYFYPVTEPPQPPQPVLSEGQNLPTTPVQPVDPRFATPPPYQESGTVGNPPVKYFPPVRPLPPEH